MPPLSPEIHANEEEALMEDRPKIRPRPELLKPADLEAADDIVSDLVEEEPRVGDFMLAIAAATVGITVALIRRESYPPMARLPSRDGFPSTRR